MKGTHIFLIIVFLFLFSSCDSDNDFDGTTTVRGNVIDKANSIPINGVKLTISYASFMGITQWLDVVEYTNEEGKFSIDISYPAGYSYILHCLKANYYSETKFIEREEDQYFLIEMRKDTTKTK